MSEKIAFLYAAEADPFGRESPILSFQCAKLPHLTSISIAIAFVGLVQDNQYLISLNIIGPDGKPVNKSPSGTEPTLTMVTASDTEAAPNDVPGFLHAQFSVDIQNTGIYVVPCKIMRAECPSVIVDEMEARFRVTLVERPV